MPWAFRKAWGVSPQGVRFFGFLVVWYLWVPPSLKGFNFHLKTVVRKWFKTSSKTSRVLQLAIQHPSLTLSLAFWNVQHVFSELSYKDHVFYCHICKYSARQVRKWENGRVAMNNWVDIMLNKNLTCPYTSPTFLPSSVDSQLNYWSASTHCLVDELWKIAAPSSYFPGGFLAFLCAACNRIGRFFWGALAQMTRCRK